MKNSGKYIALYLFTFFAVPFVPEIPASLRNFGLYLFLMVMGMIMFKKEIKKEFEEFKPAMAAKAVVFGVIIIIFEQILNSTAARLLEHPEQTQNQEALNRIYNQAPILLALSSIFLAPFVEELLFRKIIVGGLKKKMESAGAVTGLVVSSAFFAFMHTGGMDVYSIVVYGGLSLFFGIFYLYEDSFVENYILHGVHNAIAMLFIYKF